MAIVMPSFDFDVNDTPTRETLIEQAKSLQISDLDLGDIGVDIVPIVVGDDSSATGALVQNVIATGAVWIDPTGTMWVMEQSGPVKLWNYEGGCETRRYFISPGSGLPNPMLPGYSVAQDVGGPNEDWVRAFDGSPTTNVLALWQGDDESFDDNDAGRINGILTETCNSGHRRANLRGLTFIRDTVFDSTTFVLVSSLRRNHRLFRHKTTSSYFKQSFHNTTLDDTRWQGIAAFPGPEASVVSDAAGNHSIRVQFLAYNFGVFQRTTEGFA